MTKKALLLLKAIFSESSTLQLPVGVFKQVEEIRKWVEEELKKQEEKK